MRLLALAACATLALTGCTAQAGTTPSVCLSALSTADRAFGMTGEVMQAFSDYLDSRDAAALAAAVDDNAGDIKAALKLYTEQRDGCRKLGA